MDPTVVSRTQLKQLSTHTYDIIQRKWDFAYNNCLCSHRVCAFVLSHYSYALFFVTLWTLACQSPPSIGFSRQECWVGCHALLQGIFQFLGLKLHLLYFLHWQAGFLPSVPLGKPIRSLYTVSKCITAFGKIVSINDVLEDLMCHGRQNYSLHVNTSNFSKLWMIIWWQCLIKKWIFLENIEKPAKTRVYIFPNICLLLKFGFLITLYSYYLHDNIDGNAL